MQTRRDKVRLYQAKYRARLRGDKPARQKNPLPRAPGTPRPKDMTPDERRVYNARLKADSRERQTSQKKRRNREKARQYMREKRARERGSLPLASSTPKQGGMTLPQANSTPVDSPMPGLAPTPPAAVPGPSNGLPSTPPAAVPGPSNGLPSTPPRDTHSRRTLYNLKAAVKKILRRPSPEDSATILEGLLDPTTPEFRKAILDKGLHPANDVKARRMIFADRPKKTPIQRALGIVATFTLRRAAKIRSRKETAQVKEFYLRYDVSRVLPHARYSTKHGPAHVMTTTIKAAWSQYQMEYPGSQVSYTKFSLLRTKNVKKIGSVPAETCLCLYCQNVKYKIDAINRQLSLREDDLLPPEQRILSLLVCGGAISPKCVFGECQDCRDSLRVVREKCSAFLSEPTSWLRWGRGADSKLTIFAEKGIVEDLLSSFKADVDAMTKTSTFREHIFTAHWQYRQAKNLKFTLEDGEALMIMDFAENRKACFGSEVKSAHFSKRQITLHPIVVYWKNAQCQLVRHVLMYLSDDIKHDYHVVHHFTMMALEHVKAHMDLKKAILFSDGCASQYKGKGTFADLSLIQGLEVERAFYGSEHGKGEADGETGVLSQHLRRAVLSGTVNIRHANDLFLWADSVLRQESPTSSRLFFLVKEGDISRDRPQTDVGTIPGTRKVHQIQRVSDYVLRSRRLACFCTACKCGQSDLCINKAQVGPWTLHYLKGSGPDLNDAFLAQDLEEDAEGETPRDSIEEAHIPVAEVPLSENEPPRDCQEGVQEVSVPVDVPVSSKKPTVGEFLEVTHTTERGFLQTFVCMVVYSQECTRDGDLAVQYLVKQRSHYTFDLDQPIYIINFQDTNVNTIKILPTPTITPRGHYVF